MKIIQKLTCLIFLVLALPCVSMHPRRRASSEAAPASRTVQAGDTIYAQVPDKTPLVGINSYGYTLQKFNVLALPSNRDDFQPRAIYATGENEVSWCIKRGPGIELTRLIFSVKKGFYYIPSWKVNHQLSCSRI